MEEEGGLRTPRGGDRMNRSRYQEGSSELQVSTSMQAIKTSRLQQRSRYLTPVQSKMMGGRKINIINYSQASIPSKSTELKGRDSRLNV